MQIDIIAVGKIKEKYLAKGNEEYLKRLQPYTKINIIEVNDEKIPANPSKKDEEEVFAKEGEAILSRLKIDTYVIALEIDGCLISSNDLAGKLEELMITGKSHVTFIIGGSVGLAPNILKRADLRLSFGKFTYPHQLMRLILLEQIYRSFKIIKREPYHK